MNFDAPQLTPDEREQARLLWDELSSTQGQEHLETARQKFKKAPPHVQSAIFYFIELAWSRGYVLYEVINPFD